MDTVYEDFSVWIEPAPQAGFRVRARSRAGEGSSAFEPPEGGEDLFRFLFSENRREVMTVSAGGSGAPANRESSRKARELGGRLFRSLFQGEVRQLFERCRGADADPQRGVRLKLHFTPDLPPAVLNLPWELLYCEETREHFGLDRLNPVVRYLEVPRPAGTRRLEGPLRVLLAAANPTGSSPLDLAREIGMIRDALRGVSATVDVLEHADLETIREKLLRGSFQILHFMGHGVFQDDTGTGMLLFEKPGGGEERVSGEMLTRHLKDCLPGLVVLNACNSARAGSETGQDLFAGIASSLVLGGLPAVAAMRIPVSDRAAIAFSKALYREIAAGEPVEAAVSEARLAIYRGDPYSPEWATPVLFLRAHDNGANKDEKRDAGPPAGVVASPLGTINLGQTGRVEGEDVDIANQIGDFTGGPRSAAVQIDGQVKGTKKVTIANWMNRQD